MIYGIGIYAKGKHRSFKDGVQTKEYAVWTSMLRRCYGKHKDKHITYENCTVCKEWLYFQNFADWYCKHEYYIENDNLNLDKDLLVKGNTIYSPSTCCLLPSRLNKLLQKGTTHRNEFPIGVRQDMRSGSYVAEMKIVNCNGNRKTKHIGCYGNKYDAFNAYKVAKENYIKYLADTYKNCLPDYIYNALYNYKILITD